MEKKFQISQGVNSMVEVMQGFFGFKAPFYFVALVIISLNINELKKILKL
jgi:hypothetical protein